MRPMKLRLLVALVNAAARVGDWALTTFAPSKPPTDAWHPSQGPRIERKTVAVNDSDDMPPLTTYERELVARLRSYQDYLTICQLWALPAYEPEDHR